MSEEVPVVLDSVAPESVPKSEEWKTKEAEYQKQIENLKKLNERLINYSEEKSRQFEHDLQKLQNEKNILQRKVEKIELDELKEAASGSSSSKNMEAFKEKYDGVLRRAQDLLFERQKQIKSMELKNEAQNIQVESLKEAVSLTKDMLLIREMEIRDLTERMEAMTAKFSAEKDRKNLMERKIQLSDKLNTDLKAEYKAQKDIFNILRDQYKVKVEMLERKLKDSQKDFGHSSSSNGSSSNGTSS